MKNLIIYGAGDYGEELVWYINEINAVNDEWRILGFIDDGMEQGTVVYGYPVLGAMDYLENYNEEVYVICSIALPHIKKKIIEKLSHNNKIKYPVIIHPSAVIADDVVIGEGTCVGANAVISIKAEIGRHAIVDQLANVGHHSVIGEYTLIAPGSAIGGHVKIGNLVDMGIGCRVMMLAEVEDNVILGAGAVVVKNIPANCTAVGVPAKPIKFREE